MGYTLSNYTSAKKKKKHQRKKTALAECADAKTANIARKISSEKASEVSMTFVDAQRENRQASNRWKAKARKLAFGFAIGIHAVALIVVAVWFVKKTVLQMNEDKMQSVIVKNPPTQTKRTNILRKTQKTVKPKAVEVLVPKGNSIAPNTNINLGPADFTMPVSDLPSDNTKHLSTLGIGTAIIEQNRQVKIITAVPKFELPKFSSTGLTTQMDMGTSLIAMEFGVTEDMGLSATNFGGTKQSFSEFLRQVRERIKEVHRFPPNVRNLDEGSTTTIRFTLLKDGTIRDPKVSASSGSRVLDNAALAAVQNAEPYPPFPDGQSGNSIRLELPVVFELVN